MPSPPKPAPHPLRYNLPLMLPKQIRTTLVLLVVSLALSACNGGAEIDIPAATLPPGVTATAAAPTATSIPLAFTVNGEGVSVAEYEAELQRYIAAQNAIGRTPTAQQASQAVLDDLIAQVLLAQGAQQAGYNVDDGTLQRRIDVLTTQLGSPTALSQWQADNGYTDQSFRAALKRALAAAWMRDQIAAQVPPALEQVHAQQILVFNEETAQRVLTRLDSGVDFDALAAIYDPATRGDLGWFPRGYLLEPAVEEAAFALQPGDTSPIIKSGVGYHVIYIIARESSRPLAPDALLALKTHAVQDWVTRQREQSAIVLAP